MKKTILFVDRILQRYTPDPFVFAILLTFLAFGLAILFTPKTPSEVTLIWGEGFWSLTTFTLQMVMILLGGYVLAVSPPVRTALHWICRQPKNSHQAIVLTCLISCFASWLNWGFGLVAGAFVALEMARVQKKINFRLLVASAYSGFILWHGGLSGSIPLLLNTTDNFTFELLGRVTPLGETIFSPLNLTIVISLIIALPGLSYWLSKNSKSELVELPPEENYKQENPKTPAEFLEKSFWPALLIFLIAVAFTLTKFFGGTFRLDLNQINFLLFFAGLIFHGNFHRFIQATINGAAKVGPLLIQYPFYAGIMSILKLSGLAALFSHFFVQVSNATFFPLLTFMSAGVVNIFVPSGGGQWAVQGPIVLPAAQTLGANLTASVMAVAWGDAWTNLLQPFWALPLLAIVGLKIKDIIGFCILYLLVSGVIIGSWLTLF